MTWTRCEVYWDLDFEPSINKWRAASGIWGVSLLGLEVIFLSWILIIDPWVLSPEIPVAASQS